MNVAKPLIILAGVGIAVGVGVYLYRMGRTNAVARGLDPNSGVATSLNTGVAARGEYAVIENGDIRIHTDYRFNPASRPDLLNREESVSGSAISTDTSVAPGRVSP